MELYVLPYGQMSLWGNIICPKCIKYFNNIIIISYIVFIIIYDISNNIISLKVDSNARIGPHNIDIIYIIYGILLGNSNAKKRITGTAIIIIKNSNFESIVLYFHSLISELGYCNPKIPTIYTRLGKGGKVWKIIQFNTFTYSSLDIVYNNWYNTEGIKVVPHDINDYFSSISLAIWIIEKGALLKKGIKIDTSCFSFDDCNRLSIIIINKFNLKTSIVCINHKYYIYVLNENLPIIWNIIYPYINNINILYKSIINNK